MQFIYQVRKKSRQNKNSLLYIGNNLFVYFRVKWWKNKRQQRNKPVYNPPSITSVLHQSVNKSTLRKKTLQSSKYFFCIREIHFLCKFYMKYHQSIIRLDIFFLFLMFFYLFVEVVPKWLYIIKTIVRSLVLSIKCLLVTQKGSYMWNRKKREIIVTWNI